MAMRQVFYCDLCNRETANFIRTDRDSPGTNLHALEMKYKPQSAAYSTASSFFVCTECSHDFDATVTAWIMKRRLLKSGA